MLNDVELPETNTVLSFVCYEWREEIGILQARDLLEEAASIIGQKPDIATVCNESMCKDYRYKNLECLGVMQKKEWTKIAYRWNRNDNPIYDYSISILISVHAKMISMHIDEGITDDAQAVLGSFIELAVDRIKPVYAIGYSMPYSWRSHGFASGIPSSNFSTPYKTFYGPPQAVMRQVSDFAKTRCSRDRSIFWHKIRDVFEWNLIADSHLEQRAFNTTFREWIVGNSLGTLTALAEGIWVWTVPEDDIPAIRQALRSQGLTIVTS